MTISFGFPFTRDQFLESETNMAWVFFKLSHSVQEKTMVYNYDLMSMIAEIGGYSGLLLGISVLDLSKLALKYF